MSQSSYLDNHGGPRRWLVIVGVALLHLLLALAILMQVSAEAPVDNEMSVEVVDIPADAPPDQEGAESAANFEAEPIPMSVPPPVIEIERPPVIVAPRAADDGPERQAGAADADLGGTQAGDRGDGTGTGAAGFGRGGGGVSRAVKIGGDISDRDYPRRAAKTKRGGTVTVHYDVTAGGRVTNCQVVGSSGNAELDATTCRLAEARFRYRPATRNGVAISDVAGWQQVWWLER
ncbi:MAG: TonB family protein [Pacificimonas sp.]